MATAEPCVRVMRIIARMNVGGPAVQVCGLMRHLDRRRFEQRLVTGYCGDDEADYLSTQAPDVSATYIQALGRTIHLVDDVRAFALLRRELKRFRPHIVHTHTAKAGVLGRLAALTVRPRPKLIHTYHGHLLHSYFSLVGTCIVILIERFLAVFTDHLVAVGPEVRDDLLRVGIGQASQFRVIEPGLELREYPSKEQARKRLDLATEFQVVSVLGRITRIKRPDRMLNIVERVAAELPNLRVIVAGDGDLRVAIEASSLHRNLPITFLGWREDVENVLAASDLTLLTSDNEGTPLSIIQAAMLGVPAVATDVGSVAHIVRDGVTGWLTERDDESIVKVVVAALQDGEELVRRGRRARELATKKFAVSRLASDYEHLYRSMVQSYE